MLHETLPPAEVVAIQQQLCARLPAYSCPCLTVRDGLIVPLVRKYLVGPRPGSGAATVSLQRYQANRGRRTDYERACVSILEVHDQQIHVHVRVVRTAENAVIM